MKVLDVATSLSVRTPPIFSFAGVSDCNHILSCISTLQPPTPTYQQANHYLETSLRRSFISTDGQYHDLLLGTTISSLKRGLATNDHLSALNRNGYSTDRVSESNLKYIYTVLGLQALLAQDDKQT